MKESEKNDTRKPGLEEALHPEIGNDALWTNDAHAFSLSTVDPLKSLDQKILNEETSAETLSDWKTQSSYEVIPKVPTPTEPKEIKTNSDAERATRIIRKPLKTEPELAPLISLENEVQPVPEQADTAPKKDKKKKDKTGLKASKRVRKLAEKMNKEDEDLPVEKPKISPSRPETALSPFTHWLKGLTGSEYVHPYDDDFAFNQGSSHAGEGISETFADLLATQGYKDQAIAMYTRLMEKFPEKSRFFAAKIEALQ